MGRTEEDEMFFAPCSSQVYDTNTIIEINTLLTGDYVIEMLLKCAIAILAFLAEPTPPHHVR